MFKTAIALAALATMIAASSASADPTVGLFDSLGENDATARCGHLEEVRAAQEALRDGRKQAALSHFRNARDLLRTCSLLDEPALSPAGRSASRTRLQI